jgi:hypothetical protein
VSAALGYALPVLIDGLVLPAVTSFTESAAGRAVGLVDDTIRRFPGAIYGDVKFPLDGGGDDHTAGYKDGAAEEIFASFGSSASGFYQNPHEFAWTGILSSMDQNPAVQRPRHKGAGRSAEISIQETRFANSGLDSPIRG